jgi:hypothetical protein
VVQSETSLSAERLLDGLPGAVPNHEEAYILLLGMLVLLLGFQFLGAFLVLERMLWMRLAQEYFG